MAFYKVQSIHPAADYLAGVIKKHLNSGQTVLWLVTGGSAISVAVQTSKILSSAELADLLVTLTDERFVPLGDKDSNWKQLMDGGLQLPGAQLFPVLDNKDIERTTAHYDGILRRALDSAQYKIGLFGMGPDGHLAALFPGLPQVDEKSAYAAFLNDSPKPPPRRLTMTALAIQRLDEAVVFAMGSEKKVALQKLEKNLSPREQPAQILKALPKLTVYNDQIGEKI